MSSEANPASFLDEYPTHLKPGDWHPATANSLRSPCPVINSMANHGYIPRDGRNVTQKHLRFALKQLGIGFGLTEALARGSFLEHEHKPSEHGHENDHNHDHAGSSTSAAQSAPSSDTNPLKTTPPKLVSSAWGCGHGGGPFSGFRPKGQVNYEGTPILNLDQIGRHGAVEHDISLSRRDWAQGDHTSPQPDLIAGLINCSSDKKIITTADLGKFRQERYAQAKRENPNLDFGPQEESMACGEAAILQATFGQGGLYWWNLPVPWVKAIFEEERFPYKEGWKKRSWVPVLVLELGLLMEVMKRYAKVELSEKKKMT